jgi:acetylglutamate kinase
VDSQYHSTIVVKLGGSTLGGSGNLATPDTTLQDLLRLHAQGYHIILVHGGGNATSDLLRKMGEEPRFLNGLRVTDDTALQAATMMLRGVINAQLVDTINRA